MTSPSAESRPVDDPAREDPAQDGAHLDAVVVGAGFAGIYALHRLRRLGMRVEVLEAGDGVGGTWHWNRYPGARVDVESLLYSYSFSPELQQEWRWLHRYAPQAELQQYADHVVDRFGLREHITLNARVVAANYDAGENTWTVTTEGGLTRRARYLVAALGSLSIVNTPSIPGLDDFDGLTLHTSQWPEEPVALRGKRVGVIGTGSTGIQLITAIAPEVEHLHVFQRTPNFSLPITNAPMDPEYERGFKQDYGDRVEAARQSSGGLSAGAPVIRSALDVSESERQRIYEEAWQAGGAGVLRAFTDLMTNREANETAAEFVRSKIREIVRDPDVAERLSPRGYPIGTKRICMDTGYFETFNRPNVTLVDVRSDSIVKMTESSLETASDSYPLDVVIFATGFDAVTGPILNMGVTGPGGTELPPRWENGPRTFLGLATSGFPNLFMVGGPLSLGVLANGFFAIEQHVDFLANLLEWARERGYGRIEATPEAEDGWVRHVAELADRTLYPEGPSWYVGANIEGKPRVFMLYSGGFANFRRECEEIARSDYEGFVFSRS